MKQIFFLFPPLVSILFFIRIYTPHVLTFFPFSYFALTRWPRPETNTHFFLALLEEESRNPPPKKENFALHLQTSLMQQNSVSPWDENKAMPQEKEDRGNESDQNHNSSEVAARSFREKKVNQQFAMRFSATVPTNLFPFRKKVRSTPIQYNLFRGENKYKTKIFPLEFACTE